MHQTYPIISSINYGMIGIQMFEILIMFKAFSAFSFINPEKLIYSH